ncbi:endonuclease/exonuclease/phosphatase family protein [Halomonas sp. V046]|uniref:endonuclease/exonuclease/phosphatase family protein n=1 Tax=Halomonas sp. V046 TaxID=3459611 RepID=UPI004044D86A
MLATALDVVLVVVVAILVAATLLARIPTHWWWLRACEFPRLQIGILGAIVALLSPLAEAGLTPWIATAGTLVFIIQLAYVLPWTPLWPIEVQAAEPGQLESDQKDRCITLLIANVLTPNRRSDALIEMIREHDPDIVLTLESDDWWGQRLDAALNADWPNAVRVPLDNLYGMHLYSRLPLIEPEVKWLIQDDIPSIHCDVELRCGDRARLHALHPRPPAPGESTESLWRDAELSLVAEEIHRTQIPTLVAGDLNDVAWSRSTRLFCRVSGMLDPRRGRGMFSSFHAGYPLLRWPLDHVFSSEHFTLAGMARLPAFGSDHFPILASLCFRPSRRDEHDAPEANAEERSDAQETVAEARQREQGD